MNETFFREIMSAFLFSPSGSRFQTYFHFDGNLTIGKPTPQLLVSANANVWKFSDNFSSFYNTLNAGFVFVAY